MKNLSHLRFKGTTRAETSFRPYYEQPWPSDLPESCQICGTKFRRNFNLTYGLGQVGRRMKAIAYWGFLPCMVIGLVLPGIFPELYGGMRSSGSWWLLFGSMFIPPALLGGLSATMPTSRHLECKKCGWNRDYETARLPLIEGISKKA
ncbi:MAG: hypothetical protein ACSHX9_03010 [Luteolibacter sp.]